MLRRLSVSLCLVACAAVVLAGCSGTNLPSASPAHATSSGTRTLRAALSPSGILAGVTSIATQALCAATDSPQRASCLGSVKVLSSTTSSSGPAGGLEPNDLASIYDYAAPASQGPSTQIVGVVVAYGSSTAESDLATYRAAFGLPACTSANGCFVQVGTTSTDPTASLTRKSDSVTASPTNKAPSCNVQVSCSQQPGPNPSATTAATDDLLRRPGSVTASPTTNYTGWAVETETDLEAVSAVCANCKIVLSVAPSDQLSDLGNAVAAAVQAGATIVSASFGAAEDPSQTQYAPAFQPSGVRVVAAAGDSGPGVLFPASSPNVVAVAGTTVNVSGTSVSERLWSGSGGGCSAVFARPAWQSACSGRSVADISAVADPNTGIAFYDSVEGGWGIVGGTSISAPIVAAMWALSGDTKNALPGAERLYQNAQSFSAVSGGGAIGGLGTPNGTSAF